VSENKLPILAVDDEEVIRHLLISVAETLDLPIQTVPSSQQAKELFEHSRFGLILTDVVMPGESGLDLCIWLRKKDPDIPIIVMSGNLAPTDARRLEELNVRIFPKPLRLSTLELALAEFYPQLQDKIPA
jgi:CheY-like chemotaxis protein